jgi:hypothetical protein
MRDGAKGTIWLFIYSQQLFLVLFLTDFQIIAPAKTASADMKMI